MFKYLMLGVLLLPFLASESHAGFASGPAVPVVTPEPVVEASVPDCPRPWVVNGEWVCGDIDGQDGGAEPTGPGECY